jgi:hypothetical protein
MNNELEIPYVPVTLNVYKSSLRPGERDFLDLATFIGFGSIRVVVREGWILDTPPAQWKRTRKLDAAPSGGGEPRPVGSDYLLKTQHVNFVNGVRALKRARLEIKVTNGLPILLDERWTPVQ